MNHVCGPRSRGDGEAELPWAEFRKEFEPRVLPKYFLVFKNIFRKDECPSIHQLTVVQFLLFCLTYLVELHVRYERISLRSKEHTAAARFLLFFSRRVYTGKRARDVLVLPYSSVHRPTTTSRCVCGRKEERRKFRRHH